MVLEQLRDQALTENALPTQHKQQETFEEEIALGQLLQVIANG